MDHDRLGVESLRKGSQRNPSEISRDVAVWRNYKRETVRLWGTLRRNFKQEGSFWIRRPVFTCDITQ